MSERGVEEFGFPVFSVERGVPLPDLARIPKARWAELLAPLSDGQRHRAAFRLGLRMAEGMEVVLSLPAREELRSRMREPRYVAPPDARRPPKRGHQVNVRLYGRDHRELLEAASLAGAKPTELARWLIVSGVRRMLYENGREAARADSA